MKQEVKSWLDIALSVVGTKLYTEEYKEFVNKLFAPHSETGVRVTHAILGLITEIDEVTSALEEGEDILLDELGDVLFYYMAFWNVIEDWSFATEDYSKELLQPLVFQELNIRKQATEIELENFGKPDLGNVRMAATLDICKKWLGYGKEPKPDRLVYMYVDVFQTAHAAIETVAHSLNRTDYDRLVDQAVTKNMAKLNERYKGIKFDAEAAKNPDKAAEMAAQKEA